MIVLDVTRNEAVRIFRERLGMTQDEAADVCGVSRWVISQIENGQNVSPSMVGVFHMMKERWEKTVAQAAKQVIVAP